VLYSAPSKWEWWGVRMLLLIQVSPLSRSHRPAASSSPRKRSAPSPPVHHRCWCEELEDCLRCFEKLVDRLCYRDELVCCLILVRSCTFLLGDGTPFMLSKELVHRRWCSEKLARRQSYVLDRSWYAIIVVVRSWYAVLVSERCVNLHRYASTFLVSNSTLSLL